MTTASSRRRRRCPRPVVSTRRAPGQAAATAAPCVKGTSRSSTSWTTSAGVVCPLASAVSETCAHETPSQRSLRVRMVSIVRAETPRRAANRRDQSPGSAGGASRAMRPASNAWCCIANAAAGAPRECATTPCAGPKTRATADSARAKCTIDARRPSGMAVAGPVEGRRPGSPAPRAAPRTRPAGRPCPPSRAPGRPWAPAPTTRPRSASAPPPRRCGGRSRGSPPRARRCAGAGA